MVFGDSLTDPDKPAVPLASTRLIKLTGAINEVLSFRFAVRVEGDAIRNPAFRVAPFTSVSSRINPSVVQVFRMHDVLVEDFPGWHIRSIPPHKRNAHPLDVLVPIRAPRGGLPRALLPGDAYHFWVDVAIPKGTSEGIYTTEIELTSGDTRIGAINVRLNVRPVILPDEADIPLIAELDHRRLFHRHVRPSGSASARTGDDWRKSSTRSEQDAVLRSTLRMLHEHRLTPVVHELAPPVKVGARGEITIDWAQYDDVVEPCLNGRAFYNRVPLGVCPMPFHAIVSSLQRDVLTSSSGHTAMLREYLALCAKHFDKKGWLDRSYALLRDDVTVNPESVQATRDFAGVSGQADKRIKIASRLWPQDMTPYGWIDYPFSEFSDAVDIWVPPAQFYDVSAMATERASGRRTWLAVDHPPYSGSFAAYAPEAYIRVLTWQAAALDAEALYLGCVNQWPGGSDQPTPEDCVRADPNVLLYPGGPFGLDEPVPSVRLKYLRRSAQDAAYRKLLNKRGLGHMSATLGRSLAPYAGSDAYRTHFADGRPIGWIDDPALFDLARDIMVEALVGISGAHHPRARSAVWRRFMLAARRLQVHVDGTRVRLRGARSSWQADVECTLTIVNGTRLPVAGTVRWADLPAGWTADTDGRPVTPISPNSSRRVTLTARATTLPVASGGFALFPIEFITEVGAVHRLDARICCVDAVPFDGLIRIDGDLSDWPPGAANVASEFQSIVDQPSGSHTETPRRARHSTMGFTMRDREYLYVAINCESDAQTLSQASRHNRVEYDDLIPVGDELVELLIDPLNTGTRSPTDLYHIVVKPSGAYLTEKGIRFDPPCGLRSPWVVDMEIATWVSADRWTVELRIPLAAFGDAATKHTTWGFNITRYDASQQEFSTWSAASGNAYDPVSLGNLYLP